MIIVLNLDV